MTGGGIHRSGTVVFSIAMLVIGIALIVQALVGNGGLLSGRTLIGVLFVAAGAGRLYAESRRRPPA